MNTRKKLLTPLAGKIDQYIDYMRNTINRVFDTERYILYAYDNFCYDQQFSQLQGVDMNTIRLWLGHVSIDTTSIYAEADLKMKLDALRRVKKTIPVFASKKWNASEDILSFLENK